MPAGIDIVPFAPRHLDGARDLLALLGPRPQREDFWRWRFDAAPNHESLIALKDGECVALLSAFRRRFADARHSGSWFEPFDSICRPDVRRRGITRALRESLQQRGEPLVAIGGTPDTLRFLPRLDYRIVGWARAWLLPLGSAPLLARIGRPAPVARPRLDAVLRFAFTPRSRPRPEGACIEEVGAHELADAAGDSAPARGTYRPPDADELRWLEAGRDWVGRLIALRLSSKTTGETGGHPGWALGRVYRHQGRTEASILDLYSPEPSVALQAWMVAELARRLAAAGASAIRALTTCPVLSAALRANRFLPGRRRPAWLWPGTRGPELPLLLGRNLGDAPFLPYQLSAAPPP